MSIIINDKDLFAKYYKTIDTSCNGIDPCKITKIGEKEQYQRLKSCYKSTEYTNDPNEINTRLRDKKEKEATEILAFNTQTNIGTQNKINRLINNDFNDSEKQLNETERNSEIKRLTKQIKDLSEDLDKIRDNTNVKLNPIGCNVENNALLDSYANKEIDIYVKHQDGSFRCLGKFTTKPFNDIDYEPTGVDRKFELTDSDNRKLTLDLNYIFSFTELIFDVSTNSYVVNPYHVEYFYVIKPPEPKTNTDNIMSGLSKLISSGGKRRTRKSKRTKKSNRRHRKTRR